ncbi:MAG: hypothetical protein LBE76_01940 [Nitrososphaerota archaeon]|jgi:hypothetical protein|nr:hypothetical protein [Nitrososphaerota archaeon]
MKKILSTTLLVCLMISFPLLSLTSVNAQETLNIKITPDGTIEPNTKMLEQNDNVYTFKDNISGTINVHAHDIVIDGAGYTLNGSLLLGVNHKPYDDHNADCCMNVVVKNLKISNGGISGAGGRNCTFVGNYFENSRIRFMGNAGVGEDLFMHNTFADVLFDLTYGGGSLIVLTENNLVNVGMIGFGTFYPTLDRNYYGDYVMRYPYATRIADLGVWDTAYVMYADVNEPESKMVDSKPLVNPVVEFEIPHFNGPLPSANMPSTNTNDESISSSTSTGTKTPSINAKVDSLFSSSADSEQPPTDADVSDSPSSSKQTPDTSHIFSVLALIGGVLATIVIVPVAIVLATKRKNK